MATEYSEIYNIFLQKVKDYDLAELEEGDAEENLLRMMKGACANFYSVCRQDLKDRDDETSTFTDDLDDEVKEIISELMIVEWIKPRLNNTEHLRNVLNTKDFNQFSPANLLKEIRDTYNNVRSNTRKMIVDYSYRTED